jgi:hypothetical protein
MANRARGESEIEAGGRVYRLRLTLGALAEIEDGLSLNDLSEIEARLKKLRAADLAIVAAALMRGGGHEMTALEALRLPVDFPVLVRAVTQAFAAAGGEAVPRQAAGEGAGEGGRPFAGRSSSKSDSE